MITSENNQMSHGPGLGSQNGSSLRSRQDHISLGLIFNQNSDILCFYPSLLFNERASTMAFTHTLIYPRPANHVSWSHHTTHLCSSAPLTPSSASGMGCPVLLTKVKSAAVVFFSKKHRLQTNKITRPMWS